MIINSASKIYGNYITPAVKGAAKASKAEEKLDTFAVSSQAKDFQKIRTAIAKTPDVRQEKIDEIKARIENGTYKVDSDDIASKILEL